MAGQEIMLPTYNFVTGMREYRGEKLRLTTNMILVIEGIHALNPMVSEQISPDSIFKIYAAPMSPISLDGEIWVPTTVNRLLRRISRDVQTRGRLPQVTIAEWDSVRRGEKKWIEPFKDDADTIFDTSMLYELAALRKKAEPVLMAVPDTVPEYAVAQQLLKFLRYFQPIDLEQIPHTSLLREFVGGSIFDAG
jgi:uridine kinase